MRLLKAIAFLILGAVSALCSAQTTKTTTTITSGLNPSIYGQSVTFTAVVTPAPPNGETVDFLQGSTLLGTGTLSGGSASCSVSTLKTGGTDNVKATYVGDSTYKTSTSAPVEQVVNAATSTTSLTLSANTINVGQTVTFTATVTGEYGGTVTGNVNFYNGSTKLKQIAVSNNQAIYIDSTLPAGSPSISATYEGSSSFDVSSSNAQTVTVGTGTYYQETMQWDEVTRYYQVFVPTVLPANPPMLLMLHGTTYDTPPANPSTREWYWESVADQYGFIVVQPASTMNPDGDVWNWNDYFMDASFPASESGNCTSPPATACPDDAGFLRNLITTLTAQYNVNPNMVYVAGFSSGAQMAERVGVEISDLVAAIVPASGQMEGQQAEPPPVLVPGNELAPISVQEWHGTEDTELPPCNYGDTNYGGIWYYLDTVDDTFNYWVSQNSCTTLQTTQTLCTDGAATPGLSGNVATGCTGSNIEVQFIWEPNTGHGWSSQNNNARWLFMAAHPKTSSSVKKNDRTKKNAEPAQHE
jgi:poly(3-hydroxybutyrate) depolymerase